MDRFPPIAVVGMAGLFPGAADTEAYWKNIVSKVELSERVPEDRWILSPETLYAEEHLPDRMISKRACLIKDFRFDPRDINLDDNLLSILDPLHQMALHTGRAALRDCIAPVDRNRTGVILAAIVLPTDASSRITRRICGAAFEAAVLGHGSGAMASEPITPHQALAAKVTALPAALLSTGLGLMAGSFTLDAACASSLYAVKFACDELHSRRADTMLAGGVSRPEGLYTQVGFSQLRALSPSGRCSPFDASADGLVVGEGAGILVLKRCDDALRDGDRIYGLIRGIGLSNDMRGNLLAPESEGQLRAMEMAYQAARWSPRDVSLIECHGTGTPVGDTIELQSLRRLWGKAGWDPGQCAIGSVKSMIGHLLTAAGAASLIKTLLALSQRMLPPSLNFKAPPADSPLLNSPFRVQCDAEEWPGPEVRPLRAAVSAFGFGGINGHLLLESEPQNTSMPPVTNSMLNRPEERKRVDIAIVGMDCHFGALDSLKAFEEAALNGHSSIRERPPHRWMGAESSIGYPLPTPHGAYISEFDFDAGWFHIPPSEIDDILPQHLLMLKVAAGAMADAGLPLHQHRPGMGTVIGIDFDYGATDFHLRWNMHNRLDDWLERFSPGLGTSDKDRLEPDAVEEWLEGLKDASGPPLTASRTLGALGGIIASRIARECRFGGPSFVMSAEENSGIKALQLASGFLLDEAVDAVLVGAVDLTGDIRHVLTAHAVHPFSDGHQVRPFDPGADGGLPGEGAAAMVVKRLDDAQRDGDCIYGIVESFGQASGGGAFGSNQEHPDQAVGRYCRSFHAALSDAGISSSAIGLVETHGSAQPDEDTVEAAALAQIIGADRHQRSRPCAIGSVKQIIGHTGICSGFASLIRACLALHRKTLPPLLGYRQASGDSLSPGLFHAPLHTGHWDAEESRGGRRAAAAALASDGNVMHVVVRSHEATVGRTGTSDPIDSRPDDLLSDDPYKPTGRKRTIMLGRPPYRPPIPPAGVGRQNDLHPPIVAGTGDETRRSPALNTLSGNRSGILEKLNQTIEATGEAHRQFLAFSRDLSAAYARHLASHSRMHLSESPSPLPSGDTGGGDIAAVDAVSPASQSIAYSRGMCMEFAVGSIGAVLGPEYSDIDAYPYRVRLPDEPLMLVDRILSVGGERNRLGPGCVVTEHDVLPQAWYLDGGHAPVCISVEAGQADLFLCSYLGIDHAVKGERVYRLLDATVEFHRSLPSVGDTIRYTIHIDRFARQGETYLFFFRFKGYIGDQLLITMTDGCAGFFTQKEIRESGGIILTKEESETRPGRCPADWKPLAPEAAGAFDDDAIDALRQGDLEGAFGRAFRGMAISPSLRLPGNRMRLIDRILTYDPRGGRYGIGMIRAEADIHSDDWFLACHFKDDMVMPGTLMYECCAHALRIFLQRMGWVATSQDAVYEPIPGIRSVLRCRGPVTPTTRHVHYEVHVKELGYGPEPYAVADAHMIADGLHIVTFMDMGMKMSGVTRSDIETAWSDKAARPQESRECVNAEPMWDRDRLITFSRGRPSAAFGDRYKPFDGKRFIARLPSPPFLFIDRIACIDPPPWVLEPDGWIEAEFDLSTDAWYYRASRYASLPISVMMEIALQPCGWLAAYMGSALRSETDLRFRNLGGTAVFQNRPSRADASLLTRARCTRISDAGEMIIEHFDFETIEKETGKTLYTGNTNFGFFSNEAMAAQVGIRDGMQRWHEPSPEDLSHARSCGIPDSHPRTPDDSRSDPNAPLWVPGKAIKMIDRVDIYLKEGGPGGFGFVQGSKQVDPAEWFFTAHFYQDPVCPGSLGVESLHQLLRYVAYDRWPERFDTLDSSSSLSFSPWPATGFAHEWTYRGQILPSNHRVTVSANVKRIEDQPVPTVVADGFLAVDDLCIYEINDLGLQLIPDM